MTQIADTRAASGGVATLAARKLRIGAASLPIHTGARATTCSQRSRAGPSYRYSTWR
ncbi:hypothetical protein [Cupriavidus necator]|uniref:hypothetical protein n=1 Tax=Cupriavidus necator TaxID=106590 RepID=UPI0039C4E225